MSYEQFVQHFIENSISEFQGIKTLGDRAMQQVSDEEFFYVLDSEANSIAIIVKHIAGNQRSRWTDFLTSDGEKPDRNRDTEFELDDNNRDAAIKLWEEGWSILFTSLNSLTFADITEASVLIRNEPHSVAQAIQRQLTHYADHVGQIILLAKHFRSTNWKTLSIARNRSHAFNQQMGHHL